MRFILHAIFQLPREQPADAEHVARGFENAAAEFVFALAMHARAMVDVGEICGNPATASVVATADHALLGGCGEHGLKNPLREICTVGSVRGEIMVSHGGLKRARNWKRWRQPKKAYSLPRSPLLGGGRSVV